jgi:hypothetical protein
MVYRLRVGSDSVAIYGQNQHLRNLNMGWLVQRNASVIRNLLPGLADNAHATDHPPSIGSVAPVMSCAAGLHRKAAIAPTASRATNRPVGCRVAR